MIPRFVLFILTVLIPTPGLSADAKRYNLVAIVTDDQATWTLGCYGNAEAKTPNMDRLAKEGARFTNAFTVTPVCSPSRAAYMTGRNGIEVAITDFIAPVEKNTGLPPGIATWPKLLQEAGYTTALVGKYHLGTQPHQHPTKHGFTHFFGHLGGGWSPLNPTFEVNGEQKTIPGFSSNIVTDEALRWMRENKEKPFAMCVHYREPHAPYGPMPPEDEAVYKDLDPTIPDNPLLDKEKVKKDTRQYYCSVRAVDRNLGRILDELDKLKLAENTIVTFTSDHGYNIGHHTIQHKGNGHWIAGGARGPKRPNMWDTSLRIPLMVRWPGVTKPGMVIDQTVRNIDTLASMCGMLGVPLSPKLVQHGQDYSPLLRGETITGWDNDMYAAYDLHNGGLAYMRMVRTPEWKLVRHLRENQMDELYDLKNDPGETRNLLGGAKGKPVPPELQSKLDTWRKRVGDPVKE